MQKTLLFLNLECDADLGRSLFICNYVNQSFQRRLTEDKILMIQILGAILKTQRLRLAIDVRSWSSNRSS